MAGNAVTVNVITVNGKDYVVRELASQEMYSRLKEVYDDPGIPPEGRLPDPGEEGRKASYTDRITVRKH